MVLRRRSLSTLSTLHGTIWTFPPTLPHAVSPSWECSHINTLTWTHTHEHTQMCTHACMHSLHTQTKQGVEPVFFGLRWVSLLLSQEFLLPGKINLASHKQCIRLSLSSCTRLARQYHHPLCSMCGLFMKDCKSNDEFLPLQKWFVFGTPCLQTRSDLPS